MPIEVCSPINVKSGKTSGNILGSSLGAFSNPSRGRTDAIAQQPLHARVSRNAEEPAELKITGPEE